MRRLRLKRDGTRAETRFCLSAKRTSPFKSAVASVQSTTDSRGVRISGSKAGYTMLRGIVKCTGYPLHSPVSPSLPLRCVTVCHHISTGLYFIPRLSQPPWLDSVLKIPHFSILLLWETTLHAHNKAHEIKVSHISYTNNTLQQFFKIYTSRSRHIPLQSSLTQRPGHAICRNVLRLQFAHTVYKQLLLTLLTYFLT